MPVLRARLSTAYSFGALEDLMDEGGEEGVGGGLAGTQSRGQLVELRQKDRHLRHDPLLFGFGR